MKLGDLIAALQEAQTRVGPETEADIFIQGVPGVISYVHLHNTVQQPARISVVGSAMQSVDDKSPEFTLLLDDYGNATFIGKRPDLRIETYDHKDGEIHLSVCTGSIFDGSFVEFERVELDPRVARSPGEIPTYVEDLKAKWLIQ